MKRNTTTSNMFPKNKTLHQLKRLYRYYLTCMKDNKISQEEKNRQTNLIKCLLWCLGIHPTIMNQKDFEKDFLAGKYDNQLNPSFMACQKKMKNKTISRNKVVTPLDKKKMQNEEPLEILKKTYVLYCSGEIPYETFWITFQNYFYPFIDVYSLNPEEAIKITKRTLSKERLEK